jgi:hypothetical protein
MQRQENPQRKWWRMLKTRCAWPPQCQRISRTAVWHIYERETQWIICLRALALKAHFLEWKQRDVQGRRRTTSSSTEGARQEQDAMASLFEDSKCKSRLWRRDVDMTFLMPSSIAKLRHISDITDQ